MSLQFSLLLKADAAQAKTELRALQGELTKTGTGAKGLGVDAKGASTGVDVLGKDAAAAAVKLKQLSDAQTRTAASAGQLNSGSILAGNSARMFSQQLSQVGQQTMATGQFVQALAIQLPDIGIGFGAVGGAVGLLAGIALPLLVAAFSSASTKALSAEDAVEQLSSALDTYKGFVALSAASTAELTAKFGDFAIEVRGFAEYMKGVSLGTALTSMDAAIEPLKGNLAGVMEMLGRISVAQANVNRLELDVGAGIGDVDALVRAKETLEILKVGAEDTAASMGLLPEQARALAVALDEMGAASGIRQIRDEASDALQLIQQWYPAGAALPPELATAASYLDEIIRKSAETTAELEGASAAAYSLSSAPIAAAISAALGPASRLNATLQSAAGWFDSIRTQAVVANFNRDSFAGSKTYSGRGGDPRDFMPGGNRSGTPFVYDGPNLDRFNNPVSTGGGRGGASAARAEKDAVAELIAKLREEQETLRETDPIKLELMKHRKVLAEATAAERTEVENLIRAEQQLKAVRAAEDFASQSAADFLDAIIVQGASAEDALKSLLSSLIKVGIQALMLGEGPLAGILGIQGGLFSGMFGGGAKLPFMATGGYVQALATGGDSAPRMAADARRMSARDARQMRRLTAGDALQFATAARQAPVNGLVTGEGGPRDDKVATWLSAGEYVVNGRATAQYRPLLERINAGGGVPGFAQGGMIGAARGAGGTMGGLSGTARGDTHIHIHGAMGNTEIHEMVKAGVQAGIEANNTHVLPDRVLSIVQKPRVR